MMYEYGQPVLPGLEELDPQPILPFEDVAEIENDLLLQELDILHETMNEFEQQGMSIESWVEEIYEVLESEAVNRGLMRVA